MSRLSLIHYCLESVLALGAILYTCWRAAQYITRATDFMVKLGRNHIPHIYTRLDRIDDKLGLPRTLNTPANVIPEIEEVGNDGDRA